MKRKYYLFLLVLQLSFVQTGFGDVKDDFPFSGIWAAYSNLPYRNSFLVLEELKTNRFLAILINFDNGELVDRSVGKKVNGKLLFTFNNLEWTIEGIADYENGKLVYEGLVMYVDPDDEGVIGFDRVETINPQYLVPEADR